MDRQTAFNPEKNQNSQGGLKHSQGIQSISSQSVIAELDIRNIHPFHQIPDYTCPTISPNPIVVISPAACNCIDGWDLIQKGKSTGVSKIVCCTSYIPKHCEIEIAIRKVAVRTMPQAGTCSYAELVRNAGILFKMLVASKGNPTVFSHGGSRRGVGYAENKENNIRILLANRLGKSVTTISKYLNHGEFLNAEAINALIKAEAEKGFFEAAQQYKRKILADLKYAHKSHAEISAAVSETILTLVREYQANKQSVIAHHQTVQKKNPPAKKQNQIELASGAASKPKEFSHWNGNSSAVEENQATENDVRREIKAVASELLEISNKKDFAANQMVVIVTSQIVRLARLIHQLKQLDLLNAEEMEDRDNG